ncbi:MAG: hypothetical protein WCV90_06115 [Candidatus Woesearchaeota archaeon]|jgi:rubrerythrin
MAKKYFKCSVCGDIHYGNAGPEICPTCQHKNAYKEIPTSDAKKLLTF